MKKMEKQRKGFTLTELAIVIAVIAILIAVLVPTFTSLINKANQSKDSQMLANINTALATEDVIDGVNTPGDALDVAEDLGYTLSKLTPSSDGDIVYDETSKSFALVSDGEIVYAKSGVEIDLTASTTWYFAKSSSDIESNTAKSYIVAGDWSSTGTLTYTGVGGLDTSHAEGLTIVNATYSAAATSSANTYSAASYKVGQNSYKATDGEVSTYNPLFNVSVGYFKYESNTEKEINNYGSSTITAVSGSVTFNEYGVSSMYDTTALTDGYKIVAHNEEVAESTFNVSENTSVTTVVEFTSSVNTAAVVTVTTTVEVTTAEGGGSISITVGGVDIVDSSSSDGTISVTLELGNEQYPYLISSVEEWMSTIVETYSKSADTNNYYWKVTADLDFNDTTSDYQVHYFKGHIDFDGHKVTLQEDTNYYALFIWVYGNSSISNLNLVVNYNNALSTYTSLYSGDITLSDITISGTFMMTDNNVTPFVERVYGYGNDYVLTYKNCTNEATITTASTAASSIFLGKVYEGSSNSYGYAKLVFDTCVNNGALVNASGYASMLISNGCTFANEKLENITVKNCVNNGKIYGSNTSNNTNLLCGAGWSTIVSVTDITSWIGTNSANLKNGEEGICEDTTFTEITLKDGEFDLDSLTVTQTATSYAISFAFWVEIYDQKGGTKSSWGSYAITINVKKLSEISSFPAYSWISESDLPSGATTSTIKIGDKTLKTYTEIDTAEDGTETKTTYYVFEESFVSSWATGYVTISDTALTLYEYINSSIGVTYTYAY